MLLFRNIAALVVFSVVLVVGRSAAFAEEPKKTDETYANLPDFDSRGSSSVGMISRRLEVVSKAGTSSLDFFVRRPNSIKLHITAPNDAFNGTSGLFEASSAENVFYRISHISRMRAVDQAIPRKAIPLGGNQSSFETARELESYAIVEFQLSRIPWDDEKTRPLFKGDAEPKYLDFIEFREKYANKYVDIAARDFEAKLKDVRDRLEKQTKATLARIEKDLADTQKQIGELTAKKAEAERADRNKQYKSGILSYLYQEEVRLKLDLLEQRTKLDMVTASFDVEASIAQRRSEMAQEYGKAIREINDLKNSRESAEKIAEADRKSELLREKLMSLNEQESNPKQAKPSVQYADVKISLAATEKRYAEVKKLIAEYEQVAANAAELPAISNKLKETREHAEWCKTCIKQEQAKLADIAAHPVRLMTEEEFNAKATELSEK